MKHLSVRHQLLGLAIMTVGITGVIGTVYVASQPSRTTTQAYRPAEVVGQQAGVPAGPEAARRTQESLGPATVTSRGQNTPPRLPSAEMSQSGRREIQLPANQMMLFGLDVDARITASRLCRQHTALLYVADYNYDIEDWNIYYCDEEGGEDFEIEPNKGYAMRAVEAEDLVFRVAGRGVVNDYAFQQGWNLSIIEGAGDRLMSASDLCADLNTDNQEVDIVYRWGSLNGVYEGFICGNQVGVDFELQPLEAYWVRVL